MEDKDMTRVELKEHDIEQVVGGAFNWYYDSQGAKHCKVDGVGTYNVTATAQDRWLALMLEHKLDGWTAADFVNVLVSEGQFF